MFVASVIPIPGQNNKKCKFKCIYMSILGAPRCGSGPNCCFGGSPDPPLQLEDPSAIFLSELRVVLPPIVLPLKTPTNGGESRIGLLSLRKCSHKCSCDCRQKCPWRLHANFIYIVLGSPRPGRRSLLGRREKTPTPKTRFSIWTLLRTPGRFTTRPLPVYFTIKFP